MNQKTIKNETGFSGKALQTGTPCSVVCRPSGPDTGIIFKRVDLKGAPCVKLTDAVLSDGGARRSTIGADGWGIQTVEHFLAALWSLEIDNILVEVHGAELPAMDGSAAGFLAELKKAGAEEQPVPRRFVKVPEEETVEEGSSYLKISPADVFSVSYYIDYDIASIRKETFRITPDKESFEKELAPARTFCLKREAEMLLKAGLGQGATLENTLVLDDNGPVGTEFRFPNEPVRHKVLDLLGDLYMLGRPVIGKVEARKSGHKLNAEMVGLLYRKYLKEA